MAANPLVSLGSLNLTRASVKFSANPQLNVTPSFLTRAGVTLALNRDATRAIEVNTGIVPSPEVYIPATVRINLLKTQALSGTWKGQLESNTLIGDFVVRADAQGHPPYQFTNGYILNIGEITTNGSDPTWQAVVGGTYYVNSGMWP